MESIQIGSMILDRRRRLLVVGDQPVKIHARALAVLEVLALHMNEVLGKRTLIASAWPDGVASESNLMVQVSRLRALLASADPSVKIGTRRRVGYFLTVEGTTPAVDDANAVRSDESAEERELLRRAARLMQQCRGVALNSALEVLDTAVEKYPRRSQPRAYRALGLLRLWHHGLASPEELERRGAIDIECALLEEPNLALAHAVQAAYVYVRHRDFLRADVSFRHAIELAPNEATAHEHFADSLLARGRFREGRAHLAHARWCQPENAWLSVMDALALYLERSPKEARARLDVARGLDEQLSCANALGARLALSMGDLDGARRAIEDLHVGAAESDHTRGLSALFDARSGRVDDASEAAGALERGSPLARFYAAATLSCIHRGHEAIDLLHTLIDQPVWELCHLAVDPMWDRLREHPRFESLLRAAGLTHEPPSGDPA